MASSSKDTTNSVHCIYSIYMTKSAVELHREQGEIYLDAVEGRLISSQPNYECSLELAIQLAREKGFSFRNCVPPGYR